MGRDSAVRDRLSIDISREEHRKIKAYAALHGETMREFVVQSIHERLRTEEEEAGLGEMARQIGPALKELWDNEKDASYDKL